MTHSQLTKALLLSSAMVMTTSLANAQTPPAQEDEIIVVGTQIKGSNIAGILPVTSLGEADIELTGAVSGDELLAAIPQLGDVTFTETNFGAGVNDARGDVGSVNLRGVGDGNTLVLLNGRRLVNHPGTKAVNQTPVVTVNSNAIPVTGIKRLEVLRDGASAVYGTDAVAGVINTELDDDYEGLQVKLQYGTSEGTSLDETSGTVKWGKNFNGGKTNISIFGNVMLRNGMPASDLRNSSTEDLRPFFEGTIYEGDTQLRNTSSDSPWGTFHAISSSTILSGIGDDEFHVQPSTTSGCLAPLPGGNCADNGNSVSTDLRLNRSDFRDIVGDTDRYNMFAFVNHELGNNMEFFGEASYYYSDFSRRREMAQLISSQREKLTLPGTAFYNPFNVDLRIGRFRPIDVGQRTTNVTNDSFRLLGGLRGDLGNWDWETAFVHTEAHTEDKTNRVSLSLFQDAISRTDATAYNPFAVADPNNTNVASTFNSQATIDSFMVDVTRDSTTKLTLADAKFSNPAVFSLPAGDVGAAIGVEWRHEYYQDDRDDRLDGTIQFTDDVTGEVIISDVMGSSPTPDTTGDRDVLGAFVELAIPLIGPDMDVPFAHSFDVQLAARAEDYSDAGSVLKPKVAASWFPVNDRFQVRGSYSEGFRAPNLEQINATAIRRVNTGREDYILCQVLAGNDVNFTSDDDCDNVGVEGVRSGGPQLKPESNKNYALGATFEPTDFLTLTLDWWKISQSDLVGLFSDQNEIHLDYLRRLQGSSNPNVIRAAPDAALGDLFAAAGLNRSGAGEIIEVNQQFKNLDDRRTKGLDFGAHLDFDTDFGEFNIKANAAQIREFFQTPSAEGLELIAAVEAGLISPLVEVSGQDDLIKQNGNPEWRYTGSIRWDQGNWGASVYTKFVGGVHDTSVNGSGYDFLAVPSVRTVNMSVDYEFDNENSFLDRTKIKVGVRNVGDKKPPVADQFASGYFTGLHSNRGRYWYASVRKNF